MLKRTWAEDLTVCRDYPIVERSKDSRAPAEGSLPVNRCASKIEVRGPIRSQRNRGAAGAVTVLRRYAQISELHQPKSGEDGARADSPGMILLRSDSSDVRMSPHRFFTDSVRRAGSVAHEAGPSPS